MTPTRLIVALLCTLASFSMGSAQTVSELLRTNPKFVEVFRDVVAKPSQSTVRIRNEGKDLVLGVVIDSNGWILTKANDLTGNVTVKLKDGRELPATWVGYHERHDLAMLKVAATGLTPAMLVPSQGLKAGTWVASAGTGIDPIAIGVISVPSRTIDLTKIPAVLLKDPSKTGYLGISMEPAESGGVRVVAVQPDAGAAKAGIKADDVIRNVNGVDVASTQELQDQIVKLRPGEKAKVVVVRGGEERIFEVTLGPRPAFGNTRGDLQNRMGSELSSRRVGYESILQHDSVVKPSDCGSPLVDLNGRVVGINITRAGRVETWAIPAETILPLLADLKSGKLPPPAFPEKAVLDTRPEAIEKYASAFLKTVKDRLDLMPAVAKAKWIRKKEIKDSKREEELLAQLVAEGNEQGISADVVREVFQSQFEAGRMVQKNLIDRWDRGKAPADEPTPDLVKKLRPKIDQVSGELLRLLTKIAPYRGQPAFTLALRETSERVLVGEGITPEVRAKALEFFLKK